VRACVHRTNSERRRAVRCLFCITNPTHTRIFVPSNKNLRNILEITLPNKYRTVRGVYLCVNGYRYVGRFPRSGHVGNVIDRFGKMTGLSVRRSEPRGISIERSKTRNNINITDTIRYARRFISPLRRRGTGATVLFSRRTISPKRAFT